MKSKLDPSQLEIVATPMCQEILRLAGVSKFSVIKNGDYRNADVAVVLSETRVDKYFQISSNGESSPIKFIKLKLNTFPQIELSIKRISNILGTEIQNENLDERLNSLNESWEKLSSRKGRKNHGRNIGNRKIKVKVHSNFLKEIIDDLGFRTVKGNDYDFLVYPDYMKDEIKEEIDSAGQRAVELPSHNNAPLDPIKRAEIRYEILERSLCMKH